MLLQRPLNISKFLLGTVLGLCVAGPVWAAEALAEGSAVRVDTRVDAVALQPVPAVQARGDAQDHPAEDAKPPVKTAPQPINQASAKADPSKTDASKEPGAAEAATQAGRTAETAAPAVAANTLAAPVKTPDAADSSLDGESTQPASADNTTGPATGKTTTRDNAAAPDIATALDIAKAPDNATAPDKVTAPDKTTAPPPTPSNAATTENPRLGNDTKTPEPAAQAATSTSLAAPLSDETARKFSGQGDANNAINLHPPGHFSTAEPLNPSTENLLKPDPATPPPAPFAPAVPFTLLGVTLNPGSASRMAWSPEDSFSGIATPTPVLVVHGAKPGPKLCLTAAVHGDEVNGIEVVRHILYGLDPNQLAGTVIGVPIVNMQGFRRNSRYLADRRDLNRFFPGNSQGSAASRIASSLFKEVISPCQYLIDIHTGSMARTNLPQLRADLAKPKVVELANLLGDIAVLQNKGAKGSLRRAAVDKGIAAVTLEAGEPYTFQETAINKSLAAIKTLLNQLKMHPYPDISGANTPPHFYTSQWLRAKAGGMLFSRASLGQAVKAGDLLGTITDPITNQSSPIHSPKDAVVLGMALNQVMHPGFAAYHLGIPASLAETQQSDAGPEDFGSDSAQPEGQDAH
ncbi:MAG: hypothetical protein RL497_2033 [Pseudomonadota bacterium]